MLKSILLFVMCLILWGCQLPNTKPLIPTTPKQALLDNVLKTDWLATTAIVGFAISIAAFINGSKVAVGTAVGCGTALVLQLTVVRYAHVITWLGLVSAVGILIYTFYIKHRAFKEIILGVQIHKEGGAELKQCLNKQSVSTKQLVKRIRRKNKNGNTII